MWIVETKKIKWAFHKKQDAEAMAEYVYAKVYEDGKPCEVPDCQLAHDFSINPKLTP